MEERERTGFDGMGESDLEQLEPMDTDPVGTYALRIGLELQPASGVLDRDLLALTALNEQRR